MAGLDADTSSYPKAPTLPAQKSAIEQAHDWGGLQQQQQQIQSGAITLSKQKLDLYNQHFDIVNNELSTLANDPKTTPKEVKERMHRKMDAFDASPQVRSQMEAEFDNLPDAALGKDGTGNPELARRLDLIKRRAQSVNDRVQSLYGTSGSINDNSNITPSRTYERGGPVPVAPPIAVQPGPTQQEIDNRRTLPDGSVNPNFGQSLFRGPQAPVIPPGTAPVQGGFPGQYQPQPQQPSFIAPLKGDTGTTINQTPNQVVQNRSPIAASLPPGAAEASTAAGAASGQVLAAARARSANFQRDVFPLAQAIPALEKLGTKGSGPGTETFNHIRSFILSNVPGTTEKTFDDKVKTFDEAKKYLTDFVNQTGNSGTNDKLAAAFAGNPSVGISNAAASDVAKSAMALRRMQQTKDLSFEDSGLQADQASRHFANGIIKIQSYDNKGKPVEKSIRINQLDPRAFGVDLMSDKAKKVLLEQLNKNPREMELFNTSLELAQQYGYLTPK